MNKSLTPASPGRPKGEPLRGCRRRRDESRPVPQDAPTVRAHTFRVDHGRQAYVNPWIDVWHYDGAGPDDRSSLYGVVHFLKRATGVIAIDDHGCLPLVGQWRVPLQAVSWEIPEGGVPMDEPLLAGAQRELSEETGWHARHWRSLGEFDVSNSTTDEVGEIFLAWGIEIGTAHPDDDEDLSLWVIPAARAIALVLDGTIRDMISQVALLTLDRHWRAGTLPPALAQILGPWRVWEG